jgi:hypothetical protein
MMTAAKSMIALGFAGAMFLGSLSPTLAASVHKRAQAPEIGTSAQPYHRSGYYDHAYSYGRTMSPESGYRPGEFVPPYRSEQTWDAYAHRWDGGGE